MQVVERVLQRRVVTVVVLRHHEHEGVATSHDLCPAQGVLLGVLSPHRVGGLVKEGEIHLGQIHQLHLEASIAPRNVGHRHRNRVSGAAGSSGTDNNVQMDGRHGSPKGNGRLTNLRP